MPQMQNIVLQNAIHNGYTFASLSPAGATEPARWLGPQGVDGSRISSPKLAIKVKRNGPDTADQIHIDAYWPIMCTNPECSIPKEVGRTPVKLTVTVPDILSLTDRTTIMSLLGSLISNEKVQECLSSGTNFY